jgi:hypothetical protein
LRTRRRTVADEINGVPCDKLFGAIARFRDDADLAQFRFSARNEWVEGTASQSTIHEWYGIGGDQVHAGGAKYSAVFDMLSNPTDVSVTRR